jgi:hypothetical protein
MEVRLGMVVRSRDDLTQKLTRFVQGNASIEGLCVSGIGDAASHMTNALLIGDEQSNNIDRWIADHNLHVSLACGFWVSRSTGAVFVRTRDVDE